MRVAEREGLAASMHERRFLHLYILWLIATILSSSTANELLSFFHCSQLIFILICLNELIGMRHDFKSIVIGILIIMIGINCLLLNVTWFAMSIVIAYCGRTVNYKKIIKYSTIACGCTVAGIIISCSVGIIRNNIVMRANLVPRYSLGFYFPSFLSSYLLAITLGWLYTRGEKTTWPEFAILSLFNFLAYAATDKKANFFMIIIVIISAIILKYISIYYRRVFNRIKNSMKHGIWPWMFITCSILSLSLVLIPVKSELGTRMDYFLSGRLQYTQEAFRKYQIRPLGNEIHWSTDTTLSDGSTAVGYKTEDGTFVEASYNYVDSSYLQMIINQGSVTFVIMMELLSFGCLWLVYEKDIPALLALLVIAVHSITDPELIQIQYSFFLMCMFRPIHNKSDKPRSLLDIPVYEVALAGAPLLVLFVAIMGIY